MRWPQCTHLFSNSDERGAEEYADYAVNCEQPRSERRPLGRPLVQELLAPTLLNRDTQFRNINMLTYGRIQVITWKVMPGRNIRL